MTTTNAGRGCRATGILIHCWWKCNWVVILRDSRTVSYKTKHGPPVQSSNHTPLYISKWVRNYVHTKTCIWMDISALSVQSLSCVRLYDPMNCSTPGLPVHHQLPESTQTHVHRVGDAIQPSHPLPSPSPSALNLSQHQGLFKWVSSSHQVAKVLEFQLQHQSFQWTPRTDLL